MLCVTIARTRHKMMLVEIQEAAKRGAELIELRLDFLARTPDLKRLVANKPCPLMATIRRTGDGGRWSGKEEQRQMLLRQSIVGGFDWVDLETDLADKIPRFRTVKRVVSYHNIYEMPKDLEAIHERMCQQDADVVKLAVKAETMADNFRVLNLVRSSPKPTVALCLGEVGVPSRVLGAKYGAPFTYAAFNKEREIAPGILSFDELKNVFRYEQITRESQVYGVVGDPVSHSLSPLIHNAAFRGLNLDAVYVPFRIPRGELAESMKLLEQLPVKGYSVTIPHKEQAAHLATKKDSFVELTEAANTLLPHEGGWSAYNTDCPAAVESLRQALGMMEGSPPITGRIVLILGAGGVARAIAHGLHKEGALLIIANRTLKRAQELAEQVGCRFIDWVARHTVMCEVVANCTSVGMHPNIDESPLHQSFLRPGLVVFDAVYTPEHTLLIKEAQQRGCYVLTGVDMFVRQAAMQFKLFTGKEPPLELMRKLVKRALSPIKIKEEDEVPQ